VGVDRWGRLGLRRGAVNGLRQETAEKSRIKRRKRHKKREVHILPSTHLSQPSRVFTWTLFQHVCETSPVGDGRPFAVVGERHGPSGAGLGRLLPGAAGRAMFSYRILVDRIGAVLVH